MKLNVSKYMFVKSIIDGKLTINNKNKTEIVTQLEGLDRIITVEGTYDYLLRMPVYSLTKDKMEELKEYIQKLKTDLEKTKETSVAEMWVNDIIELEKHI